jgi:hypothetical protein
MNGTGATSNTSNYFQRIIPFLCRVATTGSYQQNLVDPSQRGTISILSAFGGGPFTWGKITLGAGSDASGSGKVNGAFVCVPAGYTAYVRNLTVTADSTTAFVVQYRGDWSDTSTPYSPVEMLAVYDRVSGTQKLMNESETIKLPAKSEMWVAAKSRIGGTTASVSATFEVYLIATAE